MLAIFSIQRLDSGKLLRKSGGLERQFSSIFITLTYIVGLKPVAVIVRDTTYLGKNVKQRRNLFDDSVLIGSV